MIEQSDTPTGYSRNPSSWAVRLPVAGLALAGFVIAGYLALYQWGLFPTVWEPFFGRGSEVILHSWVSRLLPVPDASLGAAAYLAEVVASLVGGRVRWLTSPALVLVYGGLSGVLGLVGMALLICQPLVFGAWCTLCLASAAISMTLAVVASTEVWAALRHREYEHALRSAQQE